MHSIFRNKGFGRLAEYDDSLDVYQGHYTTGMANQFFTRADLVKHESYYPYEKDEDPFGTVAVLHEYNQVGLVRTEDNAVRYLTETQITKDGKS